jgi:serine protease
MKASILKSIWLGSLMLLVACPNNGGVGTKTISGTIGISENGFQTNAVAIHQAVGASDELNSRSTTQISTVQPDSSSTNPKVVSSKPLNAPASKPEFVAGEVLITFRSNPSARSLSSMSVGGVSLRSVRASSLEHTSLYRSETARGKAETLALIEQLKTRPDVAWAEPNRILRATLTPNDPGYDNQWHYTAINLPQAWDLETGSTNPVTVAVVDSGLLVGHPDVQGKFWPGYDFVSLPVLADDPLPNDGDGRDSNPDDPGDVLGGQGSYHGSHVAGTIAAVTNNNVGVAGISWGAKILPVRVLGVGGGTVSDIVDGILWAAGLPIQGVPNNAHPAQVINLSLGGEGVCAVDSVLQRAFNAVNAKGAIVVVAAGNENIRADKTIPAGCSGVIVVGATNRAGVRAPYSNFGSRIDLMAPGGGGDAPEDDVLSLSKNDSSGAFVYRYEHGTSMATPHVAGVIALLKSKDPTVSASQALNILKNTAQPLTSAQCTGDGPTQTTEDCGAGLINAKKALDSLDLAGTVMYACNYLGNGKCDSSRTVGIRLNSPGSSSQYQFPELENTNYVVLAWKDISEDNKINKGDLYGFYLQGSNLGLVRPPVSSVNLKIGFLQSNGQLGLIQAEQLERIAVPSINHP